MNHSKFRRGLFTLAAGIVLVLGTAPAGAAQVDPHTTYLGDNSSGYYDEVPEVKSAWSASMDSPASAEVVNELGSIAHGSGKIFLVQNGQLIALNAQTGARLWKFGAGLTPPVLYQDGVVYAGSSSGLLVAVKADTGTRKWSSKLQGKAAFRLVADQGQLLVQNEDIQAYNLQDGKLLWKDDYSEPIYLPLQIQGNLILAANSESGAYTYDVLHAFDRKTGKQLWEANNYRLPISAGDGTLLVQRGSNLIQMVALTTLDTLDAKTGKVLRSTEYNPRGIVAEDALSSGGTAWISGGNVYINEGIRVYAYPLDTDPAAAKPGYYSAAGSGAGLMYAAGPYDGRLLFCDGESVYGIKLANSSLVSYYGGGGIARFDLLGHGMYIARTDGKVVAVDLISGKALLRLSTTGRGYGPTLLENGMVIVQSKGKVTAFKEPASLKIK